MKTLIKILLICLLGVHYSALTFAQNPDIKRTWHWYFGGDNSFIVLPEWRGPGLDFSSGSPVVDNSAVTHTSEASFTMSDTAGNLLFYGEPDTVWNKNHEMMANGKLIPDISPTQMLCVPQPGNDSLYYLFYEYWVGNGKRYYAIINMHLNGGLGGVVAKNIVLRDHFLSEKITAMRHCNGTDVWIFGKRRDSLNLYVWLLTESGLDTVPVVSPVATLTENGDGFFKFSPNGKMAAAAYLTDINACFGKIELYQFDNCTGKFSNPVTIDHRGVYGLSFSPDNSKLYAGTEEKCVWFGDTMKLVQFDVSSYNASDILNSKTVIATSLVKSWNAMQIGPDGKIYVCDLDTTYTWDGTGKLGVINNPNASGLACNYVEDQVDLLGRYHVIGLPGFDESYFNQDTTTMINEIKFTANPFIIYPNPANTHFFIEAKEKGLTFEVKVYDVMGRIVLSKSSFERRCRINIDNYQGHFFFIQIAANNKTFFFKLIKIIES